MPVRFQRGPNNFLLPEKDKKWKQFIIIIVVIIIIIIIIIIIYY